MPECVGRADERDPRVCYFVMHAKWPHKQLPIGSITMERLMAILGYFEHLLLALSRGEKA